MWLNKRERERNFMFVLSIKFLRWKEIILRETQNKTKWSHTNQINWSAAMERNNDHGKKVKLTALWKSKCKMQNTNCKLFRSKSHLAFRSKPKMLTDIGRLIVPEQSVIAEFNGRLLHSNSICNWKCLHIWKQERNSLWQNRFPLRLAIKC